MIINKFIILILFIGLGFSNIKSQITYSDSIAKNNIELLQSIWLSEYKKSLIETDYLDDYYIDSIFSENYEHYTTNNTHEINELLMKADVVKKDYGLKLTGNFTKNLQPGVDDWEINSAYNLKYQTGIEMDIFKNGLFENRAKYEILQKQAKIIEIKQKLSKTETLTPIWELYINYMFNIERINLLENRLRILNNTIDPILNLHYLSFVTKNELIKLKTLKYHIASELKLIKTYNFTINQIINPGTFPDKCLPIYDLKDELNIMSEFDTLINSVYLLQNEITDKKDKNINEISIRPFVRYNYYNMGDLSINKNFLSTGLTLSVPLSINYKEKRYLKEENYENLCYQKNEEIQINKIELENLIFQYKLKLIEYFNISEGIRYEYEKARILNASFAFDSPDFNPIEGLYLLDNIYESKLQLLDSQEQMYRIILALSSKLSITKLSTMLKPVKMEEFSVIEKQPDLSIYIWSKALDMYSDDFILEYIKYNEIKTVIISLGSNSSSYQKSIELIKKLNQQNYNVELLIGDNKLLQADVEKSILNKLKIIDKTYISAIHVDVEPHTFSDWKNNKDIYLEQYLEMLTKLRTICTNKGLNLNVSIPMHYPENYVREIFEISDKVYIMAYENIQFEFLKRKLAEEIEIDSKKIVIAYRAKDFKNKIELYNQIKESIIQFNITNFALHDFRSIIEMEKAALD